MRGISTRSASDWDTHHVRHTDKNTSLNDILKAHGGMDRWSRYHTVEATIASGGGFFR
jgi:hypothetical protein